MNMNFTHKTLTGDAARMRSFGAFADVSDAELKRIADVAHASTVPAGWPLIHEQTPSDALYVLLDGEVDVYYGREKVARLHAGDIIGEAVVRPGTLRNATVSAVSPVRVLHIDKSEFAMLRDEIPSFRAAVDTIAAGHTPPSS
jgi:CRP/FNR family cyclic AMP-dependent transcriptional regulator